MKIGVDARNLVTPVTGIGRYVLEMCRHLADLGHRLVLYAPEEIHPGHAIDWAELRISSFGGAIRRQLWANFELPRLVAQDDIEVFWGPAHRLPEMQALKIPKIVTIHDLTWRYAPTSMRWRGWAADRFLMPRAVRAADRIVADSAATANGVATAFPEASGRLEIVYPGFSARQIAGTASPAARFSSPYILFVGTLEPRKNLSRLLRAYAGLPEQIRNRLPLVLAGGAGWGFGDPARQARKLGISGSVHLTGYVSDAELSALYSNARFLVMPSLYEGFGLPIIEAHARGVPVLTSNTASMPEVAGDAAVLVDPLSIQAIRAGLERLACDETEYARLKAHARANAARFDWAKSAATLEQVFISAIQDKKRNSAADNSSGN